MPGGAAKESEVKKMKLNEASVSVKIKIADAIKSLTALYQFDTKKAIKRVKHPMANMSKR